MDKFGIVFVVGANHDPAILNPDFLRRNKIVPEELDLDTITGPIFSGPVLSRVAYKPGLHIVSEQNKISFLEEWGGEAPPLCPVVAKNYLQHVSATHYVAVGVNPAGYISADGGVSAPENLLVAGEWQGYEGITPAARIKMTYTFEDKVVNLDVEPSEDAQDNANKKTKILGNVHRRVAGEQEKSHITAAKIVDGWEKDLGCFRQLAGQVVGKMGEKQ